MTHKAFRQALINLLSAPLHSQGHQQGGRRPPPVQTLEWLQHIPHFPEKGRKRTNCSVCSDRTPGGTRHLTLYHCATCSTKPSLCPTPYFETYHTEELSYLATTIEHTFITFIIIVTRCNAWYFLFCKCTLTSLALYNHSSLPFSSSFNDSFILWEVRGDGLIQSTLRS